MSLRPQPAFEITAAAIKIVVAAASVTWEAQLGREAVAAGREGVVRMAWLHDIVVTVSVGALLVLHVGVQSLRGNAVGWNQWRAAAYAGATWTGVLSCASKMNGHGPGRLSFLDVPLGPGAGAPDSLPEGVEYGDERFWRMLLSATIFPAMIVAALVNRVLFRHICLAEEMATPLIPGALTGRAPAATAGGSTSNDTHTTVRRGGKGAGSRYAPSSPGLSSDGGSGNRGHTDDDEVRDAEEGCLNDVESGVGEKCSQKQDGRSGGKGAWRASLHSKVLFGGFAKKVADVASHAAAAARSPVRSTASSPSSAHTPKRSAVDFARSPHRRDRIVAWLCEYLSLSAFDQALAGKVTEARSPDPKLAASSVDELLALVAVLLSGPDGWIRSGGEGLARHALRALAQGAGAAAVHDPTLVWRALPMMLEALQSPLPALRAAAAEAVCQPDFATAAAALLFRRHDVGMRCPCLFALRRLLDVTCADPVLISQQQMIDTGGGGMSIFALSYTATEP